MLMAEISGSAFKGKTPNGQCPVKNGGSLPSTSAANSYKLARDYGNLQRHHITEEYGESFFASSVGERPASSAGGDQVVLTGLKLAKSAHHRWGRQLQTPPTSERATTHVQSIGQLLPSSHGTRLTRSGQREEAYTYKRGWRNR